MMNFKMADIEVIIKNLNLLPIYVSNGAKKGIDGGVLSDARDMDESVEALTTYLIQKGFVSSIRAVLRAGCIRKRYSQAGKGEQADEIYELLQGFLSDIYGSRQVVNGAAVKNNGEDVVALFEAIVEDISKLEDVDKVHALQDVLKEHQRKFIDFVVLMVESRSGTISGVGPGAVNAGLNAQLDELEAMNSRMLSDTYIRHITDQNSGEPLIGVSNPAQNQLMSGLLEKIECETANLTSDRDKSLSEDSSNLVVKLFSNLFSGGRDAYLKNRNILEAESFLISLRRSVNFYQQLNILSSVLDKVNALYISMESIDRDLLSIQQETEALVRREQIEKQRDRAKELESSGDSHDKAQGRLTLQISSRREDCARLNDKLFGRLNELVSEIDSMYDIFEAKADATNEITAALAKMSAVARIYHTAIVKEAGEDESPFTQKLIKAVDECVNTIKSEKSRTGNKLIGLLPNRK